MARTVELFKYRISRRHLIAVMAGGGLLLALLAVLVAPAFIDWNRFRAPLADLVSDGIGRRVGITGDMSFRPLPLPTLRAGGVRIANLPEGRAPYFAEIRHLDMEVALWPLLGGRLQLRRVELVEPVIHLERLPDGRGNWESPVFTNQAGERRDIGLDTLRISDGRLTYRPDDAEWTLTLDAVSGRMQAESLPGPVDIALAGRVADMPFSIDLRRARALQDGRLPLAVTATFGDMDGEFQGLVTPPQEAAGLQATGKVMIETSALAGALRDAAGVMGHAPPPDSLLAIADRPMAVSGDLAGAADSGLRLKLSQGSLGDAALSGELTLTPGDVWRLEADLSADRVDLDRLLDRIDDPLALEKALMTIKGPDGLDGALDLDIGALSLGDGVISRLSLRLESDAGRVRLPRLTAEGPGASRLSLSLARLEGEPGAVGGVSVAAGDLRRALRWLSIAPNMPDAALLQGSLESSLRLHPRAYALADARLRLDGMEMTGRLSMDMTGERATLSTRLRAPRLDVDAYIPPGRRAQDVITAGLSALARIDGDMDIAIDRLDAAGLSWRGVHVIAASDETGLDVRTGRVGDVLGNTLGLTGQLRATDDAPAGRLALTLRSPDIAVLARDLDLPQPSILRQIGPGEIMAKLTLESDAMGGSAEAVFAGGRLTTEGRVTGWPWAPAQSVALTGHLAHPDHRGLARRLGLGALDRGDSGPVMLDWTVAGDGGRVVGDLDLRLLGARLTLSGALADPLAAPYPDGALDLRLSHPEGLWLARSLGLPRARTEGPALPLALTARIGGAPDVWTVDALSLDAGSDSISGNARLDLSGARPRIEARLDADSLSFDRLLMPPQGTVRHGDWSRRALPTGWLTALDGSLDLRADGLSHAGLDIKSLSASATLSDGVLRIAPLSARLFDAPVTLDLEMADAVQGVSLAVDLDWRDAPLQRASALLLGVEPLSGKGRFSARVETAGASPHDLIAGMTGSLKVSGATLTLAGLDLGALSRRISEADDPRDLALLDLAGWRRGSTSLADVGLTGALAEGKLRFSDAVLSGSAGDIVGNLTVDLTGWRVSGDGVARLAAHPGLPPAGLSIAGPLSGPRLALDLSALRQKLSERLSKPPIPAIPYAGPPRAALYGAPATVGAGADT